MNPVIFSFGPLSLSWYGVFIVGGAVLAALLSARYAANAGEDPDHIWNLLAWTMICGIIGARLYHVFSTPADGGGWPYYRQYPLEIINFWSGGFQGLGIYGGLVGGLLAVLVYCRVQGISVLRFLDFIAPNVLLAQAIGRLGNWVNQELYGPPTDLPWAFHINPRFPCQLPANRPQGVRLCGSSDLNAESIEWYATHGFHPTFFYEAAWSLLLFGLLFWLIRRHGHRLRRGDGPLLYLIAYSSGRFWVEYFRPDAWTLGTLATAQWIGLFTVLAAAALLVVRHRGWSPTAGKDDSLADLSGRPI